MREVRLASRLFPGASRVRVSSWAERTNGWPPGSGVGWCSSTCRPVVSPGLLATSVLADPAHRYRVRLDGSPWANTCRCLVGHAVTRGAILGGVRHVRVMCRVSMTSSGTTRADSAAAGVVLVTLVSRDTRRSTLKGSLMNLTVETERRRRRWIAEVGALPGVLAYGTPATKRCPSEALALRVLRSP